MNGEEQAATESLSIQAIFEESLPGLLTLAFRVAYGVLRQRDDAEDVAQEALLRAHRRLPGLREAGRLRSWLVRIAWRLALDRRRGDRRRTRREQAERGTQDPTVDPTELLLTVEAAIDRLPEKLRVVLVLSAIHGFDTREVARLLGIPEGTAKSRLRLSRMRIVESLR